MAPAAAVTASVFVTTTSTSLPVTSLTALSFCTSSSVLVFSPSPPSSHPSPAKVYVLPASATLAESLAGFLSVAAEAVSVTDASFGKPFVSAPPSAAITP